MKKQTVTVLLFLMLGGCMLNGAYRTCSNMQKRRDPEYLKKEIERRAPTTRPVTLFPLTGNRIPSSSQMPVGSFAIDFMRTDWRKEKELRPGVPKAVAAQKAVQRIQFDILGKTSDGGLDLAYRLERRWRGEPGGASYSGFARPFNVVFHDPYESYKNGVAFSVTGFEPNTGEVYIGEYNRSLPTMYFTPNEHSTVICCANEKTAKSLVRDSKIYQSKPDGMCKVRRGAVRPKWAGPKKVLPLKQVAIPQQTKYTRER